MSERKFTHHFTDKLAQNLESYFSENRISLGVKTEYRTWVGGDENRIDIVIVHPDDKNLVLGLEIDAISGKEQLFLNSVSFRKWVHASPVRKGALLHIISSEAQILQREISELLVKSHDDVCMDRGFFYEFFVMNTDEFQKYTETSWDLIDMNWEFNTRLGALMAKVFGKRYIG